MNRLIRFTIFFMIVYNGFPLLCDGQYWVGKDNHTPFYDSLSLRYSHLKNVITDLPYSVERESDLNFYFSDLLIIREADSLLSDSSRWNRNDDRACKDDIAGGKYSLFCALTKASIDIAGEYLHRRTVMQLIRLEIVKYFRDRFNHHRLMDFNNNPQTTLKDIRYVLSKSEEDILNQLEDKEQILMVIHRFMDNINPKQPFGMKDIFTESPSMYYLDKSHNPVNYKKGFPTISHSETVDKIHETINGFAAITINESMGTGWVPYQLWNQDKLIFQGEEVFVLIKSKGGWKISTINMTLGKDH